MILLINQIFPPEPFLQDELRFLASTGLEVTLLPTDMPGRPESEFLSIPVSLALARTKTAKIFSPYWGQGGIVSSLAYEKPPANLHSILKLGYACASTRFYARALERFILEHGLWEKPLLVYTYWFSPATYAAFLLKEKFPHLRVVTRAHGLDVFPERHAAGYFPLRKTACNWADMICPCSEAGARALCASGTDPARIRLMHLGVPRETGCSAGSDEGRFCVVSCSRLDAVKRLPLMARGLAAFARAHPELRIQWHHLGGNGKALEKFIRYARSVLEPHGNILLTPHGSLAPDAVRRFYVTERIDAFINTSNSEGLPVSMMEAGMAGVPIVGTAVGGVPEMIDASVGRLIPSSFSFEEFVAALDAVREQFRSPATRRRIADSFARRYDMNANYRAFVETVLTPLLMQSQAALPQGTDH